MKNKLFFVFLAVCLVTGCARTTEIAKVILGSSTKALEEARTTALSAVYSCGYEECFEEVLKIAENRKLTVFIKDRNKSRIVLMGIPGNTNTTEVGVFFLTFGPKETKLEIASLSRSAKEKTADIIFSQLREVYSLIR